MQHIDSEAADIWRERISTCMEKKGLNQPAFADAYNKRYGSGSQPDVSRWLRVGEYISTGKGKRRIGFPAYDTMKRIADLLGVSVGYLTGETDFQQFDMEKACSFLGITEEAGASIQAITSGKGTSFFPRYLKGEYGSALCFFLASPKLKEFIEDLCYYAEAVNKQQHPVDYWKRAISEIRPEMVDIALDCWQDPCGNDLDRGTVEGHPVPTQELHDAIGKLDTAAGKSMQQPRQLEEGVKLAKLALFEKYFEIINDVVRGENLTSMTARLMEEYTSVKEMKRRVEEDS